MTALAHPATAMPAPVRVERARVLRTTVGLRPFRPDGFVVRADDRDGKRVVHHYGHGGCGISLSWGTAGMVRELVREVAPTHAAVLGCGAVGLVTARVLQEEGIGVTIYASAPITATTSSRAGAFWAPFSLCDADRMSAEVVARAGAATRAAHRAFTVLAGDARYGVRSLPLYYLDERPPVLTPEMSAAPELFTGPLLAPGDHPFGDRFALRLSGMVIEPARYLAALLDDFQSHGGTVVERQLVSADALTALSEPVVVNCAGLGARLLAHDDALIPLKGQLLLLEPQPEIDYMVVAPSEGLYMLPRQDAIVLGTSHERDCWSLTPNSAEIERLLEGHHALFASMATGVRVEQ